VVDQDCSSYNLVCSAGQCAYQCKQDSDCGGMPPVCCIGHFCQEGLSCQPDGGVGSACTTDAECNLNATFCGGSSTCANNACSAPVPPCAPGTGCFTVSCDEVARKCNTVLDTTYDKDGDTHPSKDPKYAGNACLGGDDCNDNCSWIYPGAHEWCNGQDDNCDGNVDEFATWPYPALPNRVADIHLQNTPNSGAVLLTIFGVGSTAWMVVGGSSTLDVLTYPHAGGMPDATSAHFNVGGLSQILRAVMSPDDKELFVVYLTSNQTLWGALVDLGSFPQMTLKYTTALSPLYTYGADAVWTPTRWVVVANHSSGNMYYVVDGTGASTAASVGGAGNCFVAITYDGSYVGLVTCIVGASPQITALDPSTWTLGGTVSLSSLFTGVPRLFQATSSGNYFWALGTSSGLFQLNLGTAMPPTGLRSVAFALDDAAPYNNVSPTAPATSLSYAKTVGFSVYYAYWSGTASEPVESNALQPIFDTPCGGPARVVRRTGSWELGLFSICTTDVYGTTGGCKSQPATPAGQNCTYP
jgi:hypothetical protein